eukprot:11181487-Lingulodinium_polyedra.AAC.1
MLKNWREENQSLMVVDYVAEMTFFLSIFTVIVIDDYNSLDRKNNFGWEEGLDKEYKAWAEELSYFKNVVYTLPTDGPRFEMPQSSIAFANEK